MRFQTLLTHAAHLALAACTLGQSTAFTYQRELAASGVPASGAHDLPPSFNTAPTVVVTANAICCRARVTTNATNTAFVHVLDIDTDALTDSPFTFIAIGQ